MQKKRNLGLDMARSIAIILVLISHSRMFFQNYNLQFLSICGLLGVEIFFVLSGFLVGKILIRDFVEISSKPSLMQFYLRRWLRTLPLYYLVMILIALFLKLQIPKSNLIFLQNFNETKLGFMPVSWSLSIEEWFYLLIPFVLFISIKLLGNIINKKTIFFAIAFLIGIMSFILRIYNVIEYIPSWDFGVRKQVFLRMDSMMVGVLLSGIKYYYKSFYNKIVESKIPMVSSITGFILIGIWYIGFLGAGVKFDSQISKVLIFSLISIICMFFILWLENNKAVNYSLGKTISSLITEISILSYSLYLVHFTIYGQLAKYQGFIGWFVAIIISVVLSIILNRYFEAPIMRWRDKIT